MTDRLDSWKEIAAHLNRQVRTVQRWEKSEGLPIHRHIHATRGTVFALKSELDGWLHARTAPSSSPGSTSTTPDSEASDQTSTRSTAWLNPGRAVLATLALALAWFGIGNSSLLSSDSTPLKARIVVLPFRTLGTEPIEAAVSTGFLEEVITHLARLQPERLAVIGRTSAVRFGDAQRSPEEIGQELDVGYVVEGSLKRQGDRLRVTTRLLHVERGDLVWSEAFDLDGKDLFLAEQRVSQSVARGVGNKLLGVTAPLTTTSSVDPKAHDALLRGRYLFHKGTGTGFRDSRVHFETALKLSPDLVEAHVGLAHAHNLLGRYGYLPPADTFPAGRAAAARALELDPHCAEAHASLALARFYFDWDFPEAARGFQRAIELAPGLALAHHWYAHFLSAMGLHDEAIREVRVAQELEPLWALITSDAAWFYYRARKFDQAIEASERALEMEPGNTSAATCQASSLTRLGKPSEAWTALRRYLVENELLERIGAREDGSPEECLDSYWRWARESIERASKKGYVAPINHAYAASASNGTDDALHWLEVGLETRDRGPLLTLVHPHFDGLRDDPRFQAIVDAVGFPEDPTALLTPR